MYSIYLKQIPLLRPTIMLVIGILCSNQLKIDNGKYYILCSACAGVASALLYFIQRRKLLTNVYFFICNNLFFLFLGAALLQISNPHISPSYFGNYIEDYTLWSGQVQTFTPKTNSNQVIINIIDASGQIVKLNNLNGKAVIYTKIDSLTPGDIISFEAQFKTIEKNNNRYVFDYQKYMQNQSIYYTAYSNRVDIVYHDQSILQNYRSAYLSKINELNISETAKSILLAMIAGDKSKLGDLEDLFRKTGAAHVLAISGLHVGIIALLIGFLLSLVVKKRSILYAVLSILGIWSFCLLSGAFASTIRASFMISLYFVGLLSNKKSFSLNLCFAAAFIMLLYDSKQIYNIGFQFSFLAVISILLYFEVFSRLISVKKFWDAIWKLALMSVVAQIFILPFSLYYFHTFPIYFIPASLVAVPITFVIVLGGIITVILSFLSFQLPFINRIVDLSIQFLVWFLDCISNLPMSTMTDIWPTKMEMCIYFGIVGIVTFLSKKKISRNLLLACFGLLFICKVISNQAKTTSKAIVYAHQNEWVIDVHLGNTIVRYYEEGVDLSSHWHLEATESFLQVDTIQLIPLSNNINHQIQLNDKSISIVNEPSRLDSCAADFTILNTQTNIIPKNQSSIIDFSDKSNSKTFYKNQQFIIQL